MAAAAAAAAAPAPATPKATWWLAFAALHATVLLWGFTSILGKLISYESLELVWHRMSVASVAFVFVPGTIKQVREAPWRLLAQLGGIGVLLTSHWLTFFGSIHAGNSASVTLACLGLTSLFSAVLGPFFNPGTQFKLLDIILGVVVLGGVLLICAALAEVEAAAAVAVHDMNASTATEPAGPEADVNYRLAVGLGCLCALIGTMVTMLNKNFVDDVSPLLISFMELFAGAALLTIVVPVVRGNDTKWYAVKVCLCCARILDDGISLRAVVRTLTVMLVYSSSGILRQILAPTLEMIYFGCSCSPWGAQL